MNKLNILENITTLDDYNSIEETIEILTKIKNNYGEKYDKISVELEGYSIPYDDNNYYRISIKGTRKETDEEYKVRKDNEK